jgi:hypothetical protein
MTNQHVIPYSPLLSALFNCHINVEFCASIKAIQYLFKYQLKGSDQATISLKDPINPDEISLFQSKRYVGSMEAMWRILQFPSVQVKPAITRLPIHLENQQRVLYNPNNRTEAQEALDKAQFTMLTQYFKANQEIPAARNVHYSEFPEKFTYNSTRHKWYKRKKKHKAIGRMYAVHPRHEEKF